ncbi:MAG: glucose-1-phosphate cytidylyltransferase [Kiritimatiellia bacterium]
MNVIGISQEKMPPTMILCGGQGTRLRDVTELLPKPMVPVGNQPIIWHIMKGYAAFGVKRFILCLGYKREAFIDYFLNYHTRATDITVQLGSPREVVYHGACGEEEWEVTLADTGEATMTGGRIARAMKYLRKEDNNFFLTYGDAVANINFAKLLDFHCAHEKVLSVSAVHPSGRFGELGIDQNGSVIGFNEKPETEQGYINGGFMVANRSIMNYLTTDSKLVFEQQPMRQIQKDGQMAAFQHNGFWQCMDTPREHILLNEMWNAGNAPWTLDKNYV